MRFSLSMTVPSAAVVQAVEALPAPRGLTGRAYGDDAPRHLRRACRLAGLAMVASADLRSGYRPDRRKLSAVTDIRDSSEVKSTKARIDIFDPEKSTSLDVRPKGQCAEDLLHGLYRTGNPAVLGFPLDRWLCGPFFRKVCLFQNVRESLHRPKVTVNCDTSSIADIVKCGA
jgi:hypothetical protein